MKDIQHRLDSISDRFKYCLSTNSFCAGTIKLTSGTNAIVPVNLAILQGIARYNYSLPVKTLDAQSVIASHVYLDLVNRQREDLVPGQLEALNIYAYRHELDDFLKNKRKTAKNIDIDQVPEIPDSGPNPEDIIIQKEEKEYIRKIIDDEFDSKNRLVPSQRNFVKGVLQLGREGYLKANPMSIRNFNNRLRTAINKIELMMETLDKNDKI